jgi:hypothetical protein
VHDQLPIRAFILAFMRSRFASLAISCFCLFGTAHAQTKGLCNETDWFETAPAKMAPICQGILDAAYERRHNALFELSAVIQHDPGTVEAYRAHEALLQMAFREGRYRDALKQADAMLLVRPEDTGIENLRTLLRAFAAFPDLSVRLKRSVIPYVPTADANPHLLVRIDGRRELFYADTGANISVMSDALAAALKLKITRVAAQMGDVTGATLSQLQVAEVDEVRLGGSTIRHVCFVIVPAAQPPFNEIPVDQQAILGIQVLLSLRTFHVNQDGSIEIGGVSSGKTATPIAFYQSQPVVQMEFDGRPMLYTLDTGAIHSTLNPLFRSAFSDIIAKGEPEDHTMTGVGGATNQPSIRIAKLTFRLAGRTVTLAPATVLTKQTTPTSDWAAGNLGYDLLMQSAPFTLDFNQMVLKTDHSN